MKYADKCIWNSSNNADSKIDTSLFEQMEDLDLKNQLRIKNLPDPISIRKPASKNYVDNKFNDPSIIKHCTHRSEW